MIPASPRSNPALSKPHAISRTMSLSTPLTKAPFPSTPSTSVPPDALNSNPENGRALSSCSRHLSSSRDMASVFKKSTRLHGSRTCGNHGEGAAGRDGFRMFEGGVCPCHAEFNRDRSVDEAPENGTLPPVAPEVAGVEVGGGIAESRGRCKR